LAGYTIDTHESEFSEATGAAGAFDRNAKAFNEGNAIAAPRF
jgi:hypothetical protein